MRSLAIDQTSTTTQTSRIESLASGNYRLKLELFSQHNLQGVVTGTLEVPMTITGDTAFATAVGAPINAVRVLPESAQVQVPASQQFYPEGLDGTGVPTFAAAGSYTWQAFGGVGSVNSSGAFLSSSPGNGSVRATHQPTGRQSSAVVTVQSPQTKTTKWTILVYLNAANDLYSFSTLNVNQMERVASNADVRFVLQWKQSQSLFSQSTFDGTRRVLVAPDQTSDVVSPVIQDLGGSVDMGKKETLADFIQWGKTYYPAQRYGLIVWNHGNGWRRKPGDSDIGRAVSYDDQTGNAIQIWELNQALGGNHFDFLAWDASLMQMIEVAYEVRNSADYVVGSEESPPGEGYPYDTIFDVFRQQPDATTRNLTKSFVDGMLSVPGYSTRKITQSVLETAKLPALERSIDTLAGAFLAHQGTVLSQIQQVRTQSQAYSQTAVRYYRDLYDVCSRFEAILPASDITAACADVRAKLQAATVWEGHNGLSPASHGLAIDMSPSGVLMPTSTDYARLQFGQANRWDDWLLVTQ